MTNDEKMFAYNQEVLDNLFGLSYNYVAGINDGSLTAKEKKLWDNYFEYIPEDEELSEEEKALGSNYPEGELGNDASADCDYDGTPDDFSLMQGIDDEH